MPPKAEITKEKILDAAFELARASGIDSLTARTIAQRLRCSTQPIYSAYGNMPDVKEDVYQRAVAMALAGMREFKDERNSPVLNLALGFLQFAKSERQLFRTAYLSGRKKYDPRTDTFIGEEMYTAYLRQRGRLSAIAENKLKEILLRLSIFLIGMGTLMNTDAMELEMDEATAMIHDMYEALLLKEGIANQGT